MLLYKRSSCYIKGVTVIYKSCCQAAFFFLSAGTLVALIILEAVVSVICLAAGRLEVM
jgi:hypothetical protein